MKMNKKSFLGILAILLVILLVLVGIAYSRTDLFKTPDALFYKYLAQNMEIYPKIDYDQFLNEMKNLNEKDYKTSGDISIKIDGNQETVSSLKELEKLKVDYKTVKVKNDSESEMNIMYSDKEMLKINTKSENTDKYAIKINGITDKYLGIENKNLKELATKLGISETQIPDKIESIDLYDFLYISKEDLSTIKDTYYNLVKESISKDKFSSNKNIETIVNDKTIKVNAYTLQLTKKERLELQKKILENLKNDELVLNLIETKAKKINKDNQVYTKENIKKKVDELINDIDLDLKDVKDEETTEIIVYESKGKIVKTEVKEYENESEKEENKTTIELNRQDDRIIAEITEIQNDREAIKSKITKKENTTQESKNLEYDIDINNEGEESKFKIAYTQSGENTNIEYGIEADEINISLLINSKTEYEVDDKIEKINDENTIILNNKTPEEISLIFEQIVNNAKRSIVERLNILGIDENILGNILGNKEDGLEDSQNMELYMDLMKKYQNGEITEEQLNKELDALGM